MQNAEVTQRLDASGEWRVTLPLTDPRTASLALNRIWKQYRETEGFVFAGIIESIRKVPDDSLEISGSTLLSELLYRNTLLNRSYDTAWIDSILADLLSGSGWVTQTQLASNVVTWHCQSGGAPAWSVCACSLASYSGIGQPAVTGVTSAVNASWQHEVPPGVNRKLVVAVSVRADVDVTAVSFGGVGMTQGPVAINAGQNRVEFWYLDNPAVGIGTIVITGGASNAGGAISFANAATGALTDSASATGFSVTPTVTQAALSATKIAIAAVCAHDVLTVLDTTNHSELWNESQQASTIGAGAISPELSIVTVRFDGESVLKAILSVLDSEGLHLREHVTDAAGVLTRTVDRGAFGVHSGVTLMGGQGDDLLLTDSAIRMATDLTVEDVSQELWNWIIPLGAGEGTAQLTLEQQTRVPNLILNPSFEDGLTNWTPIVAGTSTNTIVTTRGAHGRQSLTQSRVTGDIEVWQEVVALPGQTFQVEGWTYNDALASGVTKLTYEFRTSGGAVLTTADIGVVSELQWEKLTTGAITAPGTTAKLRIRLRVTGTNGTTGWDYVRVWCSASDLGQPYDVYTQLTDPTSLFPTINWYLADAASIAAHGQRQRIFVAKDIAPLAANKPSLEAAADALYALAVAQLAWWRETQTIYSVNAIELPPAVMPGDLVRLRWKGTAKHFEQSFIYLDVDTDLWVLERRRHFDEDGSERSTLVVSTIDRQQQTSKDVVIGNLENTSRIYRTHIQTSVVPLTAHFLEELDATHPMTFDAVIPDNVVQLLRYKMRIKPRAIRSPVSVSDSAGSQTSGAGSSHSHTFSGGTVASGGGSTSGGGAHQHAYGNIGPSATWNTPAGKRAITLDGRTARIDSDNTTDIDTGVLNTSDDSPSHTHSTPNHSHGFSGGTNSSEGSHSHTVAAHTHSLTFGIFEGTSATNMTLSIDGTDRTVALTGAATFTGTQEFDITNWMLDSDGVVVQGAHAISIGSSQLGRVEIAIEGIAIMAPFRMI